MCLSIKVFVFILASCVFVAPKTYLPYYHWAVRD
jgi:hypothetical protein